MGLPHACVMAAAPWAGAFRASRGAAALGRAQVHHIPSPTSSPTPTPARHQVPPRLLAPPCAIWDPTSVIGERYGAEARSYAGWPTSTGAVAVAVAAAAPPPTAATVRCPHASGTTMQNLGAVRVRRLGDLGRDVCGSKPGVALVSPLLKRCRRVCVVGGCWQFAGARLRRV